ncbi:MAG: DUF59 domain-containing protein [Ignavibacteria bacterium]|nr:DUF59 domain-containing protein [Ignavibacteria bacterium]
MLTKIKNLFSKEEKPEEKNESGVEDSGKEVSPESSEINSSNDNGNPVTSEIKDTPIENVQTSENTGKENINTETLKEEVIKVLKTCYDPEIPVDVWELGLIYEVIPATNGDVMIVMTLTSPSCPVAGILPGEIEQKVREHPMVNDCKVQLTFDPPWNQNMMSEVAKLELGFL